MVEGVERGGIKAKDTMKLTYSGGLWLQFFAQGRTSLVRKTAAS